ncbi:hypothetical protein ES703_74750 [subsurface metagenome]
MYGGQDNLFAHHILKTFVFGVDRYRRITEYRFRAGGGYGDKFFIVIGKGIANVVKVPADILVLYFKVGECRDAAGTPVDNALAPVDKSSIVEPDKGSAHRPARPLVQCEHLPVPIAGDAKSLVLF